MRTVSHIPNASVRLADEFEHISMLRPVRNYPCGNRRKIADKTDLVAIRKSLPNGLLKEFGR